MEKILFVDDDRKILNLLEEEFSDLGYQVILAESGWEALRKLETASPRLVIMDLRMPGMDGIESLVAMMGKSKRVPIIIHSAFPEYQENLMTRAAEAYVAKSPDFGRLAEEVRRILTGSPPNRRGNRKGNSFPKTDK